MKKRNSLLVTWIVMIGCWFAAATPPSKAKDEAKKTIVVDCSDEFLLIDGVKMTPLVEELVELWGPPSRIRRGYNDLRIWDDLGIRAYSSPGSVFVKSLTLTMRKENLDNSAKSVFTGKVELPKAVLTNQSSAEVLSKVGFTPNATLKKFLHFELPGISFLAEIDEKAGGALVALSMEFELF